MTKEDCSGSRYGHLVVKENELICIFNDAFEQENSGGLAALEDDIQSTHSLRAVVGNKTRQKGC